MTIIDINPPPAEPIDLPYAKMFLRVDHDADNALITDLIRSARERVEALIRGSLITRRRLYTRNHARSALFINHSPVTAIHRIGVIDDDGDMVDVSLVDTAINLRSIPAAICLTGGKAWTDYGENPAAIEVEIEAGHGPSAADIPMPLRQALLLLIAQSYEYRDDKDVPGVPMMVDALLMPYRGLRL